MTEERKRLLEKIAQGRNKTIMELLNIANFQGAELLDLQEKYNLALVKMRECSVPCAFCGYSDDGAPQDQYDEDEDPVCRSCDNNGGEEHNWEFDGEFESTPDDALPDTIYLFKDGFCPDCGGDTHGVNDAPMKCNICGWMQQAPPAAPTEKEVAE